MDACNLHGVPACRQPNRHCIFDKLDAQRVEAIVQLVSGDNFGQIFITDTNRDHLDRILSRTSGDYRIFTVEEGEVKMINDKY